MLLRFVFCLVLVFISSAVVPDDIRVFQKRSNENSVYNFKRFPVKFELSFRIIFIRPHDLSVMYFMCLCHVQSADKIIPRCL